MAAANPIRRKLVKTRIIATVGPACEDADTIRKLIVAGVDIFRLNFAHGSHEWLSGILERIREISKELQNQTRASLNEGALDAVKESHVPMLR